MSCGRMCAVAIQGSYCHDNRVHHVRSSVESSLYYWDQNESTTQATILVFTLLRLNTEPKPQCVVCIYCLHKYKIIQK